MLNIDTNQKNKKIFNPNGSSSYGIWNITKSSILVKSGNVRYKELYIIRQDEEMRPDLIAYKKFGDQGMVGSLMKLNGFSNPFAIDVGDLFYIPTSDSFDNIFNAKKDLNKLNNEESGASSNKNALFRKNQRSKKFSSSAGREKYLAFINNGGKGNNGLRNVTTNLPPNILEDGERPVVTKSGLIFFGPDATSPNG